jgi:hypothetical protein
MGGTLTIRLPNPTAATRAAAVLLVAARDDSAVPADTAVAARAVSATPAVTG